MRVPGLKFESCSPHQKAKEAKTKVFQSFQKPIKNMVKPANPRIRRFFAFKAVFNFYKNTQKFCSRIVAHLYSNVTQEWHILTHM